MVLMNLTLCCITKVAPMALEWPNQGISSPLTIIRTWVRDANYTGPNSGKIRILLGILRHGCRSCHWSPLCKSYYSSVPMEWCDTVAWQASSPALEKCTARIWSLEVRSPCCDHEEKGWGQSQHVNKAKWHKNELGNCRETQQEPGPSLPAACPTSGLFQ